MIGLGTVINAAAIIVGGIIGLFGGKWLKPQIRETVTKATGVCVIFIGVAGVLEQMLTVEDGKLTAGGTTMLIVSIALGGLYPCGEGAGYAGGIISAAVDGIKCAEAVINSNNN